MIFVYIVCVHSFGFGAIHHLIHISKKFDTIEISVKLL